ncbi:MAG: ADP-forming succinate--CoA ligase subunit beta [Bacteroidetes bacterium]|nr:ADP-forming succinate--CoA ligase subunit beta [Bacteroidota bacterium]
MNLHEYQAKQLFAEYGLPLSKGIVADTAEGAVAAADQLGGDRWVVKAQVHAGCRGKAGGVKLMSSKEEIEQFARSLLGTNLVTFQTDAKGQPVNKVFVEQCADIERELYLGAVIDRSNRRIVFMASTEGGVEIEKVAAESPEKIVKETIEPELGLLPYQARKLAFSLGLEGQQHKKTVKFLTALYNTYSKSDCTLVEINPLVVTVEGDIVALDAKMNFDDNALFRQKDIFEYRDINEEDPLEIEASKYNLNYIKLDGNVGCMVNGAGLAMATMDIIKLAGGEPANFLDVGGAANKTTVANGFKIILSDPNVKAILINIFGGIVRCDRVAQGVIDAANKMDINVPIVVRLEGTNAKEARVLLNNSELNFEVAGTLKEAAEKVTAILKK